MAIRERWPSQVYLSAVLGLAEFSRGALIISLLANYVTGPLAAPITVVGWALSSHYFLDTVCRSPSGWLVDRWGPTWVLSLGVSLEVLSLVGLMNVHAWPWVIFWVALLGVGTATHWPSVVTGTRRLSHEDSRAQSMSLVFVAWLVGSGLGPIAVNFLMGGRDRTAFLMLVAADLVALGLTFVAKHPVLHSRLRRWPREGQWLSRLWPFRFILPGMFMQNLTLGILLPVLEPYLVRVLAFSQVAFSELIAGGGAMTIVLLWPMGRLTDRFGLRFPLIGGFFIAGAALVGVVSTRQFMGLIVWGGLLGSAYAMILPSWNAFLARLVPFSVEGSVWGLLMTVEGFGMAVGPILGTRLFEVAPWLPFGFAGVILAMMGAFYWLFPLERLSA